MFSYSYVPPRIFVKNGKVDFCFIIQECNYLSLLLVIFLSQYPIYDCKALPFICGCIKVQHFEFMVENPGVECVWGVMKQY